MIFNKSDYNPFPAIKAKALPFKKAGREYNNYFYDYVRQELFLGGVVPETEEEVETLLIQLKDMEVI